MGHLTHDARKMIGRNDKCPCGSGKKYKKCFLVNLDSCDLFKKGNIQKLIIENNKKQKILFDSIIEFNKDLNDLFYRTKEGVYPVSSKMQLIGCFSIIDVLANYWFEYLGR